MPGPRTVRTDWLVPPLVLASALLLPLAARDHSKPAEATEPSQSPEIIRILDRIVANERQMRSKMLEFSPRVETYLQHYKPDPELGDVPRNDDYFLGRLKFDSKIDNKAMEESFIPDTTAQWLRRRPEMLRANIQMDQFAVGPLLVDESNFDRKHYTFHPIRWEYLGDLRCLAIDVHPRDPRARGAFEGRIWVEDHDYAIVRLNGTRINPRRWDFYVHFDCWRENLQPGLWLPVYIYSQESTHGRLGGYKAETRLWGYDLTVPHQQQEWTKILVDGPALVRDSSEDTSDMTPLESERKLVMDAERNVLNRLEKARLIAPPGPVDTVLETVVNNLRVTNHLENLPQFLLMNLRKSLWVKK